MLSELLPAFLIVFVALVIFFSPQYRTWESQRKTSALKETLDRKRQRREIVERLQAVRERKMHKPTDISVTAPSSSQHEPLTSS